jgi:phosphoadenosine phosphosulfate reductase
MMSLIEHRLDGTRDKVAIAVDRIKTFAPADGSPYYLAFSGGKDSTCIYYLAVKAGVPFEAHYNVTTLDPPELVRFIRREYPDVIFDKPKMSMWRLIEKHGILPTHRIRYCCSELKEGGGKGRVVITGVRWAESVGRAKRRNGVETNSYSTVEKKFFFDNDPEAKLFRACPIKSKHVINPIIDWTTEDVWEFIRSRGLPYCELYDQGFSRLGCIACPCARERERRAQLERWPTYRTAYLHAIQRAIDSGKLQDGRSAESILEAWLSYKRIPARLDGQIEFDSLEEN